MDALVEAARRAWERAHSPYSRFRVGAAIEDVEGRIWPGCNIESVSYGLTVCAERVAVFHAIAAGAPKRFRRLAVFTTVERLTPPCGACRQVLAEFACDLDIILVNDRGTMRSFRLADLYPEPFNAEAMGLSGAGDVPERR